MRKMLARLRVGMSPLHSKFLQFISPNRDIDCPFCANTPENEMHFLLVCPKYDALRKDLIPLKFFRNPSLFKMSLLLASTNKWHIQRLCTFVYKAFQARRKALDNAALRNA